jgi:hypothetical protein
MLLNQQILEIAALNTLKNIPKEAGTNLRRRHRNAIKKAFNHLIENPFINYEKGILLILSDSRTEEGKAKFYETSQMTCRLIEPGNALCPAFWEGYPCWHRASLAIVENYLRTSPEGSKRI